MINSLSLNVTPPSLHVPFTHPWRGGPDVVVGGGGAPPPVAGGDPTVIVSPDLSVVEVNWLGIA